MIEKISILAGLVVASFTVAFLAVPWKGAQNCISEIAADNPAMLESYVEIERMWLRTLATPRDERHYIAAASFQPIDLSKEQVTVVCHYHEDTLVLDRLEVFAGNQLKASKSTSLSNYSPSTALGWLFFDPESD